MILGASGFIGNAIYKELLGYYNTFGTYNSPNKAFRKNGQFFQFNLEDDDIFEVLEKVRPQVVISALRGEFAHQIVMHQHLIDYVTQTKGKIIFLSSANVFDAYSKFPSYEYDKTLSESIYGRFKIKIENMLMRNLPLRQFAILRLPMVFGSQSPRIKEIRTHLKEKTAIEVFPNLIINATTDDKVTQQIHYIINRNKSGIFHLGSNDLVHHEELVNDIVIQLNNHKPIYKRVYTTNDDRFLAVLPKENLLPKNLQIKSEEIINNLNLEGN